MALERLDTEGTCFFNAFAAASELGLISPGAEDYIKTWPNGRPRDITLDEFLDATGVYGHFDCRINELGNQPIVGVFKQVFAFDQSDGEEIWHAEFLEGESWLKAYLEAQPFSVLSGVITFEPVSCRSLPDGVVDIEEHPFVQVESIPRLYGAAAHIL